MKIIVVGDGKVGSTVTSQLVSEGHEIIVIDNDSEVLKNAVNHEDVLVIEGNGANLQVLKEASAENADLTIAATASDEINILSCLVAKKMGCKHTIARVRNPEYSSQLEFIKSELGLSMSVNPELSAAREIARIVNYPSALKLESFLRGRVELIEIKLNEANPLVGMRLSEIRNRFKVQVLICAIKRNDAIIIPKGDVVLCEGDKISITGAMKEITTFFKEIGVMKKKIKTTMIIGGGRISYYLAKSLSESGVQVKLIEKSHERAKELCDVLPRCTIIEGDGTDHEILIEEGLESVDSFISLTDMDEENIIISMCAKKHGVEKIITKVNRISNLDILEDAGIDTVISPKNIIASQITKFVRAMVNEENTTLESLYRIVDDQVEALEFAIPSNGEYLHKPIKNLKFIDNTLLASIFRNGRNIHPTGNDTIEPNDHVIVVTTQKGLSDIKDIFVRGSLYEH